MVEFIFQKERRITKLLCMLVILGISASTKSSTIELPLITIEENEIYRLGFDDFYTEPNMEYHQTNGSSLQNYYIQVGTPQMVVASEKMVIDNGPSKISFESSSKLIFYENTGKQKSFFIGFYNADQMFQLYNITDFNQLENDEGIQTMNKIAQADLKKGTKDGYYSGRGLNFRDQSIFYTLGTEMNGDNYVVNIQTHGLGMISNV